MRLGENFLKACEGMKLKIGAKISSELLCAVMLFSTAAVAQQRGSLISSRQGAYDMTRETVLQGTVMTYTEASPIPPIGAHVTVQTANGIVDVHLGPPSYLRSNHFSLFPGDSVRFVGVSVTMNEGKVFLARIAQRGNQSIAVRSLRGSLQGATAARTFSQAQRAQITLAAGAR